MEFGLFFEKNKLPSSDISDSRIVCFSCFLAVQSSDFEKPRSEGEEEKMCLKCLHPQADQGRCPRPGPPVPRRTGDFSRLAEEMCPLHSRPLPCQPCQPCPSDHHVSLGIEERYLLGSSYITVINLSSSSSSSSALCEVQTTTSIMLVAGLVDTYNTSIHPYLTYIYPYLT